MKKKKTITLILAIAMLILFTPRAKAVYQMSPNKTSLTDTIRDLMWKTRQMEANGQVMGLMETGNKITRNGTLLADSASNNIDVHMTKNTEFGACLILSASQKYGKQGKGEESYIDIETSTGIATTTGNKYGVYQMGRTGNWEWTAGGGMTSYYANTQYERIPYNSRYYDIYESLTEKHGDATTSTAKWKGANDGKFISNKNYAFIRGFSGAFSFKDYSYTGSWQQVNTYHAKYAARACAVCGSGF